jgi:DNA-binding winged helix-turn-helix (wHTH) protein
VRCGLSSTLSALFVGVLGGVWKFRGGFVGMRRPVSSGVFCLDVETRQLFHGIDRRPVHLSPKAFSLLCALVEARPRAVSKQELHERVWPSTFVSEATLTSVIAELREALGERGREPGFIRTVHGFGYACAIESPDLPEPVHSDAAVWVVFNGRELLLQDGEHVLGRGAEADIRLPSPSVSQRHAKLVITGDTATLEDLESKNGSFVRGRLVGERVRLEDGDRIRLGGFELVFRRATPSGSTETLG